MRFNDSIVGMVLVLFAIAEIAYSTTFPTLHGQAYGSSLFPTIIGFCMIGCGAVLIVRGLQARRRSVCVTESSKPASTDSVESNESNESNESTESYEWVQWGDWVSDRSRFINMLLIPALLIVYIVFADSIGFIPLAVVILTVLLYRLGSSLLAALSIAIGVTLTLQLLFAKVLLVPLPSGLLLPWLG